MKRETEILIIGGGILGCAIGWKLAGEGHDVMLLEQRETAGGASGGNMGQISLADRSEAWHMTMAMESLEVYRQLQKDYDGVIDYVETGGTTVLRDDEELLAGEKAAGELLKAGLEVELLYGPEASRAEPLLAADRARGVIHCRREGRIDPFAITLLFSRLAQERGMTNENFTPVTGFEMDGSTISGVVTDRGVIKAQVVINAAGAYARSIANMAGIDIPLRHHRGTAMISAKVPPMINGPVVDGAFLVNRKSEDPLRINLGLNQSGHGSVAIAQATIEKAVDDREVELKGLVLVAREMLRFFPHLRGLEILRCWSAVTPYTLDSLPVFGFSKKVTNLFFAAGFKGAFTVAPAVADRVAGFVTGGSNRLPAEFDPDRLVL